MTFSGWIFFQLFPQIWNQRKILRILNTHMPKKKKENFGVIEYIYEYMLEVVECKFARNGLTNWKTFLANIFENIIWHLLAGETHQVAKITVPYCTYTRERLCENWEFAMRNITSEKLTEVAFPCSTSNSTICRRDINPKKIFLQNSDRR